MDHAASGALVASRAATTPRRIAARRTHGYEQAREAAMTGKNGSNLP